MWITFIVAYLTLSLLATFVLFSACKISRQPAIDSVQRQPSRQLRSGVSLLSQ